MRHQRNVPLKDLAKALRQKSTSAESLLWKRLRRHGLCGFKVRRQHQIGHYIVDFYCPALRLVIEVDGGIHKDPDQKAYDERRSLDLMLTGLSIVRFTNEEVTRQPENVLMQLETRARYVLIARQGVR